MITVLFQPNWSARPQILFPALTCLVNYHASTGLLADDNIECQVGTEAELIMRRREDTIRFWGVGKRILYSFPSMLFKALALTAIALALSAVAYHGSRFILSTQLEHLSFEGKFNMGHMILWSVSLSLSPAITLSAPSSAKLTISENEASSPSLYPHEIMP